MSINSTSHLLPEHGLHFYSYNAPSARTVTDFDDEFWPTEKNINKEIQDRKHRARFYRGDKELIKDVN